MIDKTDPLGPWPQSKIDAFNTVLAGFHDQKVRDLEREWRCYETRESLIAENNARSHELQRLLPHEDDSWYEAFITLYINLYNGTRPGLVAEMTKRGLTPL